MLRVGRRTFMGGSAAASLARPAAAQSAGVLTATQQGKAVVIAAHGAREWRIDPAGLGQEAAAEIVEPAPGPSGEVSVTDRCAVHLRRLVLPGGLEGEVRLEFTPRSGIWGATATWQHRVLGTIRPLNWLQLDQLGAVHLCVALHGRDLERVLEEAVGPSIAAPRVALLEIGRALEIGLQARDGLFTAAGARIATAHLRLAPAGEGAGWRGEGKVEAQKVWLGATASGTHAEIPLTRDGKLVVSSGKWPVQLTGMDEMRLRWGREGGIRVPCEALLAPAEAGLPLPLKVTPRPRSWAHAARSWTLGLRTDREPIELAVQGGRIVRFAMPASVLHLNIAVPNSDRGRLDFDHDQAQKVVLGLAGAEPANAGLVLDDLKAPSRIGLDRACLSLVRGEDLLNLCLRFYRIDLVLDAAGARIVAGQPASPDSEADVDGPVLVAQLPPQHVMEQALLRQQRPLPDALPAVTEAQLRVLRSKTSRADELRKQIQAAKKQSEEAAADDDRPFTSFARAWDADAGTDPKPWIGPDGLLTAAQRLAARTFHAALFNAVPREVRDALAAVPGNAERQQQAHNILLLLPGSLTDRALANALPDTLTDPNERLRRAVREARADRTVDEVQRRWQTCRTGDASCHRDGSRQPFTTGAWPFTEQQRAFISKYGAPAALASDVVGTFLSQLLTDMIEQGAGDAKLNLPLEAALSGPSRLAFKLKAGTAIPLDADALTQWKDLELSVVQRARRRPSSTNPDEPEADVARILASQGITPKARTAEERMAQIRQSLKRPEDWHTALEVPARLLLSPAQDARFLTPAARTRRRDKPPPPVPVWQARLRDDRYLNAPSLRAIWSDDFDPEVFTPGQAQHQPPEAGDYPGMPTRQRTALDSADRHEFVALSSVYGLPVVITKGAPSRPEGYEFSGDNDPEATGRQGIYVPTPLAARLLTLSSLGATLDHDTQFVPLTAWRLQARSPLFESTSLERWRSLIVDGRDVVTTVVRRGYLFPLGHRASLVKITEPRIRAIDPGNIGLGYVVVETTRLYIEVTHPEQIHPVPGQPCLGRGFPARKVTLVTTRSPDLLDAAEDPRPKPEDLDEKDSLIVGPRGGVRGAVMRNGVKQRLAGRVFWPRTEAGPAGTVRWRMLIDDGATPVGFPLLFVDHAAASDPETLEALCGKRFYQLDRAQPGEGGADPEKRRKTLEQMPKDWRLMVHSGAQRAYAEELKKDDCTFATDWQSLLPEGRAGGLFDFDQPLQAAGQPPFYPKLDRAQIRPQQLQGLTGKGAPTIEVEFDPDYVAQGFREPERGAGQNFLKLIVPYTYDMGPNGDRAGAVARPATKIEFLNRVLGPAGKSVPPPPPAAAPGPTAAPQAAVSAPTSAPAPSDPDALAFLNGFFDEKAKLLGLISLKEFVKQLAVLGGQELRAAAPQLTQLTQFGGELAKELLEELRNGPIRELKAAADGLGRQGPAADLSQALDALMRAIDAYKGDDPLALSGIWSAGQRVLRAMDALSRAPVAALAAYVTGALKQDASEFLAELESTSRWAAFADTVRARIIKAADALWSAGLLQAVPFPPEMADDPDVRAVLEAEGRALRSLDWTAGHLPQQLVSAVRNDPGVRQLAARKQALLTEKVIWPLLASSFAELGAEVALLRDTAIAAVLPHVPALLGIVARVRDVITLANGACAAAFGVARRAVLALAPPLALCGQPGSSSDPLCRALDASVADLTDIAGKFEAMANDPAYLGFQASLRQLRDYARAWVDYVQAFRTDTDMLAQQLDAVRQPAQDAFPAGCLNLDGAAMNALAALRGVRPDRLSFFKAGVPPLPQLDVPAEPEIRDAAAQLVAKAAGALGQMLERAILPTLLRLAPGDAFYVDLQTALEAMLGALRQDVAEANAFVDRLRTLRASLQNRIDALRGAASLDALNTAARDLANELAGEVDEALQDAASELLERALLAASGPVLSALPEAVALGRSTRDAASGVLRTVYGAAVTFRNTAYSFMRRPVAGGASLDDAATSLLGSAPGPTKLWSDYLMLVGDNATVETDQLTAERDIAVDGDTKAIAALAQRWARNAAAPQVVARRIAEFGMLGSKLRLLDVETLRRRLEGELAKLLPKASLLESSLGLPLRELKVADIVTFTPHGESGAALPPKLSLHSNITLDLQAIPGEASKALTSTFDGRMPPFDLTILEILGISFRQGITYTGGSGRGSSLSAPLGPNDIRFGDRLSFLADLAKTLSLGGPQGPYARVRIDRPAIEAGYRLFIKSLTLGITFTNIDISVALLLPFNDDQAVLACNFGKIDSPCMISAGIYGGSCFLGFEANAGGIRSFEASFEFGGVAALGYGPLSGVAYVTTGAWIRTATDGASFAALFSAGFSAHIACFSISASFVLRLLKAAGSSSIAGTAVLTFSFKVGFFSVSYSVSVHRGMTAGFGGGDAAAAGLWPDGRVMLADASGRMPPFLPQRAELATTGYDAAANWRGYASQFDQDFQPAEDWT